jgi:RNA polymerase sigma-70 factor (ECF subfamily)
MGMAKTAEAISWAGVAPELDERFATTFRYLARLFRSRGFNSDEADEFAQETVTRALAHLERHGRRSHDLTPLLHTIAKNLIVERFRTGGRELPAAIDDRMPSADVSPERRAVGLDTRRRVYEEIAALPPKQRKAVLLWLEGLDPAEVARELGVKRGAADVLLHRARRALASRLEDVRLAAWGAFIPVWTKLRRGTQRLLATGSRSDSISIGSAIAALATAALIIAAHGGHPAPVSGAARGAAVLNVRSVLESAAFTHDRTEPPRRTTTATNAPRHPAALPHSKYHPVKVRVGTPYVRIEAPNGLVWVTVYDDPRDQGKVEGVLLTLTGEFCKRFPNNCSYG